MAALSISEVAVMWRSTERKACAVDWAAAMCGVRSGAVDRSVAIDCESWCTTADDGDGAEATGRVLAPPLLLLPGTLIAAIGRCGPTKGKDALTVYLTSGGQVTDARKSQKEKKRQTASGV